MGNEADTQQQKTVLMNVTASEYALHITTAHKQTSPVIAVSCPALVLEIRRRLEGLQLWRQSQVNTP